ncbi:MAG: type I DNA topoisomerase [Firmicutes bacterium]|nr:type I DNA topoisomerase [Bacillota bacterium]
MAAKRSLVIVESPSKARTISKFLGSRYNVMASVGHVRDLPKSRMGVKIEENFEPEYINVRGKAKLIKELKEAAEEADKIYLATDPDREGEAISWHICGILGIDPAKANRIEFHEITKPAVTAAIENPRPINLDLVDAQQGRRVIDRVVGYGISPVLWSKVSRGLSAGRVQSAALKIICDREDLIDNFEPKTYFAISVDLASDTSTPQKQKKTTFNAKLEKIGGKKIVFPDEKHDATIRLKEDADKIAKDLTEGRYFVDDIDKKQTLTRPYAPYTTSVLQQDASVRLGFAPKKTMLIAQQLYEGMNIKGHGHVGLITYMRTDSVRVNPQADAMCKKLVNERFGKEYVGSGAFSNKSQNTQDAHEAIRPSNVELLPEEIESSLNPDQNKLYKLIWSRFVASRMAPAVYDAVSAGISCGKYGLRANGRKLVFDGFLKVYNITSEEKDKQLPPMEKGMELVFIDIHNEKRATEPPSRFTEASLIKELEEKGIGRPSTYAPIVSTLTERKYIAKEKKALLPTDLGRLVTKDVMEVYFPEIVDVEFTSRMEEDLDKVAEGQTEWKKVIGDYYNGCLKEEISKARSQMERVPAKVELTDELCPNCGKPLALKHGRFGDFLACSGFPECRYTRSIIQSTGVKCPRCGKDIIVKRSRKGKTFYGCSGYPECDQVYWYKPVQKECPKCGSLLVERGRSLVCSNPDCDHREKK